MTGPACLSEYAGTGKDTPGSAVVDVLGYVVVFVDGGVVDLVDGVDNSVFVTGCFVSVGGDVVVVDSVLVGVCPGAVLVAGAPGKSAAAVPPIRRAAAGARWVPGLGGGWAGSPGSCSAP